ncbi:Arm DNA-binding domain-containing protein [Sphingomonas aurantiaca]
MCSKYLWGALKTFRGYPVLTELRCRQAKPAKKSYTLSDARGLHMLVKATGFGSCRWRYRTAGEEKLFVLGSHPEVSLARAYRDSASRP